jgi:hypothetical protein
MQRWFVLFVFVFLLFLNSCRKDTAVLFDYTIQGLDKVSSNIGETKTLEITVVSDKGSLEEVVLNLMNVPKGVSYLFTTDKGTPNYTTTLSLTITQDASLGDYSLSVEAVSATTKKTFPLNLVIDDELSLSVSVYDATKWNAELPWGLLTDSATIRLYNNEDDFLNGKTAYSEKTNAEGKVHFYRMVPGDYLFVVEKGDLSNIAEKTLVGGKKVGFVTAGIFMTKNEVYNSSQPNAQPGDLKYRDQNADGKITDLDRMLYDQLSIYPGVLNQKILWIGK